jgi:hypothetical protein
LDAAGGGWFSTTGTDPSVLVRMKEDYDGAEPSASSISVLNLLLLSHLTGDSGFRDRIDRTLGGAHVRIVGAGRSVPMMLASLSTYHAGVQQVVLVGSRADQALWAMAGVAARRYLPFAVCLIVEPGEQQERLARLAPQLAAMRAIDANPTAYVCREFACQQPTTDIIALEALLAGEHPARWTRVPSLE